MRLMRRDYRRPYKTYSMVLSGISQSPFLPNHILQCPDHFWKQKVERYQICITLNIPQPLKGCFESFLDTKLSAQGTMD